MSIIKILMVEDDKDQQVLYEDAIDAYNEEDSDFDMLLECVESAEEAIKKLNENSYDAIFLDLILKDDSADSGEASGNTVLSHVINESQIRLVVYVVSGTLHSLSTDFDDLFENPLMRKFDRSQDTRIVIDDLVKVLHTGVTRILGGSGQLDKFLNDIFFKHLSKGFDLWVSKEKDCEKEFLRYATLHLLEYLDLPEDDEEASYFNPEFYIYPPIKQPVATGDIIESNDEKYVLLSPSCDICARVKGEETTFNVELAVLARIIPLKKEVFDECGILYSSSGKTTNPAWNSFAHGLKNNAPKQRFHYLPKYLEVEEGVIDFKNIKSVSLTDVLNGDLYNRLATISSPFVRDVQSRFSSYYARQGQPSGNWTV